MTASIVLLGLLALSQPAVHEEARFVMGTVAVVKAEAPDDLAAEAAVDAAFAAFATVDSLMSTWRPGSLLSRLNRSAPGQWHDLDPRLHTVLAAALDVAGRTGGAFDPTVLPLVEAWGLRGREARVPSPDVLAVHLARGGYRMIEMARTSSGVRFSHPEPGLDLGGIAKGYALDLARDAMKTAGAAAGVLDLGGNLMVFGPEAEIFPVGIVAPDDPSVVLHTVETSGAAVATSGQYERFVEIDNRAYGHILDPRTGCPVERQGSVTVVAASGLMADALATALFVLGPAADPAWLEAYPGVRVIWVIPDESAHWRVHETRSPADGPTE